MILILREKRLQTTRIQNLNVIVCKSGQSGCVSYQSSGWMCLPSVQVNHKSIILNPSDNQIASAKSLNIIQLGISTCTCFPDYGFPAYTLNTGIIVEIGKSIPELLQGVSHYQIKLGVANQSELYTSNIGKMTGRDSCYIVIQNVIDIPVHLNFLRVYQYQSKMSACIGVGVNAGIP